MIPPPGAAVKAWLKMPDNNPVFDRDTECEHYDVDTLDLMEEMIPYELIHVLLADICRLENLVITTRNEVNRLSPGGPVYDLTAENLSDGIYYDSPALKRYMQLYGEWAIIPWEC